MREKRIGRIIILCAFIIIICCSRGIWFFAERYLDSTNYENRQMAVRPTFTVDGYESFSNEYTSYFNKHRTMAYIRCTFDVHIQRRNKSIYKFGADIYAFSYFYQ